MELEFFGAAETVTGSCHLIRAGGHQILLDCGLFQGGDGGNGQNREPFPFDPAAIDAVVLSHAHIDHSGRLPLLVQQGFRGPIFTQPATADLCEIMLKDSTFLAQRDADLENRKRARKGLEPVDALYDIEDTLRCLRHLRRVDYDEKKEILPGISLRLRDAGHILGSAIVELWLAEKGHARKLVYTGDLGNANAILLRDPSFIEDAHLVLMESTYGDRLHRPREETYFEIQEIMENALRAKGNILMPAFAVGRTQQILYTFARRYESWGMARWNVFLDSPMAIEASSVYYSHDELFNDTAAAFMHERGRNLLPNLRYTQDPRDSMALNKIRSGAIIVAGSGMCTGGRIRHHLKHNLWRKDCHVIISGYQAQGTLGRTLVEGATEVKLWGETIRVAAKVHTLGGLSAHADQDGLVQWYSHFTNRPPVVLVHGEKHSLPALEERLREELTAPVSIAKRGEVLDLKTMRLRT